MSNGERILLVEDDDSCREALAEVLRGSGYKVMAVASAAAAIRALDASPTAVVLDVELPDASGYDVFTALKEREDSRDVPVLFVSGHRRAEIDVVRALELGAHDYLRRPFGAAEFLARVEVALRARAALAELRKLGETDELTGLENRRAFDAALERERRRAHREASELAVVLLDVDRFKSVNDTFGHPAGDRALRAVARVLRASPRVTDIAGRIGGEEFGLILPSTSLSGALDVAERVRAEIAELKLELANGQVLRITASFGVAATRGVELATTADAQRLLAIADEALYAAKRSGRNRVEVVEAPAPASR